MEEIASFVRNYSQIDGLQQKATVCYSLWAEETGGLLMKAERVRQQRRQNQALRLPAFDREKAVRLLQFLHENAIPFETWKEIAEDVLNVQGIQNIEEEQ